MADAICKIDGVNDLIRRLAKLRQIPVAKVLVRAAQDFVQAGFMDTPIAQKMLGNNPWALLPGRGKKANQSVKVNLDDYAAKVNARKHRNFSKPRPKSRHLQKLDAYRLARPHRGFALSVWIPVMKQLGFKKKGPPGAADYEKARKGFHLFANTRKVGYKDNFRQEVEAYRAAHQTDKGLAYVKIFNASSPHPVILVHVHEPSLDHFPNWEGHIQQMGLALAGARIIRGLQKCIASKDPSKAPDSNL